MGDATETDELRALVERAREQSPDAWEQLYRRYRPRLIAYARRRLNSSQAAEDAVSEAFTRAIGRIEGFSWSGGGFIAWMYGITRNVVYEAQRSTTRDRALAERHAAARPVAAAPLGDAIEHAEERELMRRAFARLSEADREVLELRVVGDLTAAEVARVLGKKPGAIRMAQSRALERLRASMQEEAQDA